MDNTNVIIKPLVTEKTTHQQGARNVYAFEVHHNANKQQIKAAVEALYEVKVCGRADDEPQGQAAAGEVWRDAHEQLEARGRGVGRELEDRGVLVQ